MVSIGIDVSLAVRAALEEQPGKQRAGDEACQVHVSLLLAASNPVKPNRLLAVSWYLGFSIDAYYS